MDVRVVTDRFTKADWRRLPHKFPAQLVDGWLLKDATPSYDHQRFMSRLLERLFVIVGADRALAPPYPIFVDELNVYLPDVVVLRRTPGYLERDVAQALLAIEVLSPSTARRDRGRKMPRMLAAGVDEVWLVDPIERTIEVCDREGSRLVRGAEPAVSHALPGFDVVPDELFAAPRAAEGT
jgi:Uma2 family endonuclease